MKLGATIARFCRTSVDEALSWLYPDVCVLCGAPAPARLYVCSACAESLQRIEPPFCACCGLPFEGSVGGDAYCADCRQTKRHFTRARAPFVHLGPARELILKFKYTGRHYLAAFLAEQMVATLHREWGDSGDAPTPENTLLVPVPMNVRKLAKRGYNQARLLADAVSKLTRIPVKEPLRHAYSAVSQASGSRATRLATAKKMYRLRLGDARAHRMLEGKNVLLIDDVLTTGATADACARLLKHAGAARVDVLTAVRADRK